MNINRDYLIILDVKSGEVNSPNIYYFNTDKNTSNLYVQMVLRETTVEVTPIENAAEYSIKANILKPNMVGKEVEGTLVNPEKAIYEFKLPADCTDFSGNAKIEFEVYTGDKIATSFATKFKVHGSVLTEQNKYIEDSSDYPILKELMAEVKVINETAHELDTTIRTLQSDMIEANNEMKANESERQSNEVSRQTNESNRITAEETRARNEVLRETNEDTRIANEQQRIANDNERKTAENQRKADEKVRIANENTRIANENARVSAENARKVNEEQRQTNEANREVAEEIRKANEQTRIAEHETFRTEHDQTMTTVNEVKAENAVLMENDKKIADRMTQVEISDKRQYVIMEGLMNSAGDGYLKIEDTGNDTTLYNSVEGFVDVKNITGNTMVNSIKNPDDELTLNGDINTSGQSVTLTTAVDNGQVDVLAEGNTMVNVCDQQEAVAITTDTNTFPLRYLYTSTEYTLQFESDTAVTIDITLGGYTLSSQNIVIGLNKINIITPNELTDNNLILNGTGFSASNIVVTEATDKDFGYFSGMKSVGELEENKIEILSSNKNLFSENTVESFGNNTSYYEFIGDTVRVYYNSSKASSSTAYTYSRFGYKLKGEKQFNLSFTATPSNNQSPRIVVRFYDKNKEQIGNSVTISTNKTINVENNEAEYLVIAPYSCYGNVGIVKDDYVDYNIQLEEGSSATDYIPHAENKKQILLNEPLRAVGDTKDRFVQIDGKWYVERNVAEVVLNSNDFTLKDDSLTNTNRYGIKTNSLLTSLNIKPNSEIISPNIPYYGINDNGDYEHIRIDGTTPCGSIRIWLNKNKPITDINNITIAYELASPIYEPVEISPVLNTYTDVTHITNNSTIPMNMPIVNSGYELIAKPSTKYTVVGMTNGRIGDSTIVNGTITTPATLTDPFLRPYGSGTTSKVMLLEGEPANIPGYFKGIKSVFEDKVTEDGKYAVEVRVYNDLGNETVQTLYLDEPLYNTNNITIYNDKLGYWKNWDSIVLDGSEDEEIDEFGIPSENSGCFRTKVKLNIERLPLGNYFKLLSNNLATTEAVGDKNAYICNYDYGSFLFVYHKISGFRQYLSENPVTVVYQLAEPEFVTLVKDTPNWIIGSWDNCSIHFDSIIPLLSTRYRYTGNVPSVVTMSDDVAETKSISDEQDSMIVDLATQVAVLEMMTL